MSAQDIADPEEVVRRASDRLREVAAVNRAIMAGLAADGADACARAMTEVLGLDLGLPGLTLFVIDGAQLVSKARFGRACAPDRIPVGTGIAGTAAAEKRALVVTHAGVIRVTLAKVLGLPQRNLFRLAQDPGALNVIDYFDEGAVVRCING